MLTLLKQTPEQTNQVNPFTTELPNLAAVSDKYKFISTAQFISDVQALGYTLQGTTSPKRGLGMHSMTFNHCGLPQAEGLNMRLLATNSHDGTSAFRLYVQVLVQVCSNGMVAWRNDGTSDARVVHRGYTAGKVADAVTTVQGRFQGTLDSIKSMQDTYARPELTADFLYHAARLRDAKPYRIMELQSVRHREQADNNVWNVFNRVQESLIKGGYNTETITENGQAYKGNKAKAITQVKEQVRINTELWVLAVEKLIPKN